ncbi:uncharacterized protein [Dermacentor albipictus]|uniref:uncharacterized protein isoform X3 n=1 Tax=Dermacentor albipictus TaxID=60249 RepID=UPI0031FD33F0
MAAPVRANDRTLSGTMQPTEASRTTTSIASVPRTRAERTRPAPQPTRVATTRAVANRAVAPLESRIRGCGSLNWLWCSTITLLVLSLVALAITFYYISTGALKNFQIPGARASSRQPMSRMWVEVTTLSSSAMIFSSALRSTTTFWSTATATATTTVTNTTTRDTKAQPT